MRNFEQAELRSVIDDAIASLPERFRVPVILCYLEGLRHEEIAQRLGCPIGTVESRLSRARNQLRSRLARRGLSPLDSTLAVVLGPPQALSPVAFVGITERTVKAAGKLSSETIGGMEALARWLSSSALGMGPAVQAGVIVSTLVVCAAWSPRGFPFPGPADNPCGRRRVPQQICRPLTRPTASPRTKAVQEQGQQTNSKVPASFLLNAAEAERKAVTRQSGKTSALPDTPPNPANALKKTMAPSNSEEPNKENAFPIPALVAGPRNNETLKPSRVATAFCASAFRHHDRWSTRRLAGRDSALSD